MLHSRPAHETRRPPTLRRLSDLQTGTAATIVFSRHVDTSRRMNVLGLLSGVALHVESRDGNGDMIIVASGNRYLMRSRFAQRIWVREPD